MTQPPENTGGQPDGEQTVGSAAQAPPPGSWYFPPEQGGPPPYVPPPQYGTPPQYGAPQQYGPSPQYGGPPQYGAPPQQPYGTAPQQPQPPGQPYGPPQSYGPPQQPYGMAQQPYGTPYPAYPGGPGYQAGPEPGLASRWRRLFARLIDGVVVGIVLVPLSIPFLRRSLDNLQRVSNRYPDINAPGARAAIAKADGRFFAAFLVFGVLAAVILFLYDWSQHAKWGQTLGKRALHTRVVTAFGRSPINGTTAAKRSAVYALVPAIPVLGGLFALLNELWLLWDPRRQCLHDKAARTIVIRTNLPPGGSPPPQW